MLDETKALKAKLLISAILLVIIAFGFYGWHP